MWFVVCIIAEKEYKTCGCVCCILIGKHQLLLQHVVIILSSLGVNHYHRRVLQVNFIGPVIILVLSVCPI